MNSMQTPRDYIAVAKVFETLAERKIARKDMYLVQKLCYLAWTMSGVFVGHLDRWEWREGGPYCSVLAMAVDRCLVDGIDASGYGLSDHAKEALSPLKRMLDAKPESDSLESWAEILAFVWFERNRAREESRKQFSSKKGGELPAYLALRISRSKQASHEKDKTDLALSLMSEASLLPALESRF